MRPPRVGEIVTYLKSGYHDGFVFLVEDDICYVVKPEANWVTTGFYWRLDGVLSKNHEWPGKESK